MKKFSFVRLLIFIVGVEFIGFLSSMLSGDMGAKYRALNLPPFAPPGWIFGIVWPILYLLLAIAAFLIYQSDSKLKSTALTQFACNLALNFLWTPVFFGAGMYTAALVIIILLIIVTIAVIMSFGKINKAAAWLVVPYLLWLIFAAYLNLGVVLLN